MDSRDTDLLPTALPRTVATEADLRPPASGASGGEGVAKKDRRGKKAKDAGDGKAPKGEKPARKDKRKKLKKLGPLGRQIAALPFRRTETGAAEVLILTSRETRRFVIPKGWPMKKLRGRDAAAREAYEEAGVVGHVGRKPIGRYTYWKRLKDRFTLVRVAVYALEVREQVADWPEREQRLLSWLAPTDAATLVDEPGLARIIREFR